MFLQNRPFRDTEPSGTPYCDQHPSGPPNRLNPHNPVCEPVHEPDSMRTMVA